jgi:FAD/FMN-containing dehydrogenase
VIVTDTRELKLELAELLGPRFVTDSRNGVLGTAYPRDLAEMRRLIVCTQESGVALVPRGAGTSPFGGASAKEGVVVSFERLNRILSIDAAGQLARVQPGVVWQQLIDDLADHQLMPRVYPSSRAVSTVGGFVAQGGIGIGGFQFGSIHDTVEAVQLVAGDGEVLSLEGPELDLAIGAEGRTGMLMAISLRLQPLAAMEPVVVSSDRLDELEHCLMDLARQSLPVWSVSLMDRAAVGLLASRESASFELPRGRYAALFSFRRADRLTILPRLRGCVLACGARLIPTGGSNDLWLDRFMGLQALGTTPVPMQFRLELGALSQLLARISPALRAGLAFEAVVAGAAQPLAVRFFLTVPPSSPAENAVIARHLLAAAKSLGGETYATGAFFLEEAEAVYGPEQLRRLIAFHAATDPLDRLNPGKAFPTSQQHAERAERTGAIGSQA